AKRFFRNARLQKVAVNQPSMGTGEKGDGVRAVQQAFLDLGYPMPKSTRNGAEAPDGIFGSETHATTIEFQKKHTLTPDGVVGKQTMTRLDDLFAQKDPFYTSLFEEQIACQQDTGPTAAKSKYGATTARRGRA
ncbi:MAG: peptidoglycan-binding domain-containing protein, partial [Acidobacteria bacterium]|nr:peptidoglycan-binding domain-containing protein [Acidobacteriota bacterium]